MPKSASFTGVYEISSSIASGFCCAAIEFSTGKSQLCTEAEKRRRQAACQKQSSQAFDFIGYIALRM
jgi:hypothetical protein